MLRRPSGRGHVACGVRHLPQVANISLVVFEELFLAIQLLS